MLKGNEIEIRSENLASKDLYFACKAAERIP